jgi:hypothetical protein
VSDLFEPTPSKGLYPLDPTQAVLPPSHARCLECDELAPWPLVCPVDPGHTVEPLVVSPEALGYDNDDEFYNWSTQRWEYPASA